MIADCYVDGAGADWEENPYPMWIASYYVSGNDTLKVKLAAGGGLGIRFRPISDNDIDLPPIERLAQDQSKHN